MSSNLFAFQLSRPAESSTESTIREYDPQTQTLIWQGGTPAQALPGLYCTFLYGGANMCKISVVGCILGSACVTDGWNCDSLN
jgi:hypothetical protein